mmetsp:Transcript_34045/g.41928  ORF Transcript_34045/g.41928 Transcript_34045/m.41928 type:complete len:109 (+) Transcript_34045:711-1037(+)
MQNVSELALLGGHHPLHDEIGALARAVASPENRNEIARARKELLEKSNEHALYDVAGIIGFFATITTVVDFAGHFSGDMVKIFDKLSSVIAGAREMRQMVRRNLCCHE